MGSEALSPVISFTCIGTKQWHSVQSWSTLTDNLTREFMIVVKLAGDGKLTETLDCPTLMKNNAQSCTSKGGG